MQFYSLRKGSKGDLTGVLTAPGCMVGTVFPRGPGPRGGCPAKGVQAQLRGRLEGISARADGREILKFNRKFCSHLLPAEELVGGGGTWGAGRRQGISQEDRQQMEDRLQ